MRIVIHFIIDLMLLVATVALVMQEKYWMAIAMFALIELRDGVEHMRDINEHLKQLSWFGRKEYIREEVMFRDYKDHPPMRMPTEVSSSASYMDDMFTDVSSPSNVDHKPGPFEGDF